MNHVFFRYSFSALFYNNLCNNRKTSTVIHIHIMRKKIETIKVIKNICLDLFPLVYNFNYINIIKL